MFEYYKSIYKIQVIYIYIYIKIINLKKYKTKLETIL